MANPPPRPPLDPGAHDLGALWGPDGHGKGRVEYAWSPGWRLNRTIGDAAKGRAPWTNRDNLCRMWGGLGDGSPILIEATRGTYGSGGLQPPVLAHLIRERSCEINPAMNSTLFGPHPHN